MKNKSTIILGIVFLILVVIYLVTSLNPREVTKGAFPLFEGTKPDIDKVEFNSVVRGHIVLEKRNGLWYLKEPFEYKAYDEQVESMLTDLFNTLVDGVVSSRVEAHDQFSVGDSTGTSFKVYSGDELYLDVIVGKQARDIGHLYARRRDSNDIELWRGMFSQEMIREADDWRDKIMYNFNTEDIIAIEAVEGTNTRTLALPDSLWTYTENGVEKPIDMNKTLSLAALIAGLRCDAFAYGKEIPRANSKEPEIKVTFTVRNGDRHTFFVWKPDDDSPRYLVRKEDGDILYLFYQNRGSQLVIDYEQLKPEEVQT